MNEINGFETYMYEIYDDKKRPVISVCLMGRAGVWSRGIAFCCPKDYGNLKKATGRRIALHRCTQAAEKGKVFGEFKKDSAKDSLSELTSFGMLQRIPQEIEMLAVPCMKFYKGAWDVKLTRHEMDIVKNARTGGRHDG